MMTQKQILQVESISVDTLMSLFNGLNNRLEELNEKVKPTQPTVFLTRNEVSERLKISLPTIWAWSKQGILKPHRLGNKIRFIESEILDAAKSKGKEAVKHEN